MKKLLIGSAAVLTAVTCTCLTACAAGRDYGYYYPDGNMFYIHTGESGDNYVYDSIIEQDFTSVKEQNSSYFSLDRNTAAYSLIRSQIENGYEISPDSVRIEEMINYFDYDFPAPEDKAVSATAYLGDCPWNADNKLMLAGIKTAEFDLGDVNANYVFLIDVSGSMSGDNRIGLAKYGLKTLVEGLGESDYVSIVTYASGVKKVLDSTECSSSGKPKIYSAINSLSARGATNGSGGLELAYKTAQEHFITGGNNRVIMISDGDFNVGLSDKTELTEFIQNKADSGIYLSVLGVGMGNMRDDLMETLAMSGNGNYAYLDNKTEARKVFVDELSGTLKTVAKDAKAGVTFTDNVEKYRLIGYDTKLISKDDFDNEKTDTGEIGSNLCVTALYEVTLSDTVEENAKLADIEIRYKDVTGEEESQSVTCKVTLSTPSSQDLQFISCVAEFGLILRNSKYKGTASITKVLDRLEDLKDYISTDIYKQEFVTLVGKAYEKN